MPKGYIRGELPANREQKPRYRQRLRTEPFGIFRPLVPESKRALQDALHGAERTLNGQVPWKDGVKFRMAEFFGVTLLERSTVHSAMKSGSFERSFCFWQMCRRLGVEHEFQQELEVPVADLSWYGMNDSKMAVQIDDSPELGVLAAQSRNLEGILEGVHAEIGELNMPDHVTLYSFGNRKDQEMKTRLLNNKQRKVAAEVIRERLDAANIGTICLGPVVVGRGYAGAQSIETLAGAS